MDGGASWVIIWYVRGTAAAIAYTAVRDIMVIIYNPVTTTAVSISIYGLTKVRLDATNDYHRL